MRTSSTRGSSMRGPVVDVRRAHDAEVGGLEQLERGALERALRQDDAQHGAGRYRRFGPRRGMSGGRQCSRRGRLVEQPQGVREDVEHGAELLDAALRRAGRVADDRLAAHPGDAARQPAERADRPHRLGQPRRLALDHAVRALRCLVTRGEPRPTGRDDEAGEPVTQLGERAGDGVGAVRRHLVGDDLETGAGELLDERPAAGVVAAALGDAVADRQDLGEERHAVDASHRVARRAVGGTPLAKSAHDIVALPSGCTVNNRSEP